MFWWKYLSEDNNENYLLQEERTFLDEEDCQEENSFQEVRSTLNQEDEYQDLIEEDRFQEE